MNNLPAFFNGISNNGYGNNILHQVDFLTQEIKRLERRILNIEKNMMPTPYNKIKPTPMEGHSAFMNENYTGENYII